MGQADPDRKSFWPGAEEGLHGPPWAALRIRALRSLSWPWAPFLMACVSPCHGFETLWMGSCRPRIFVQGRAVFSLYIVFLIEDKAGNTLCMQRIAASHFALRIPPLRSSVWCGTRHGKWSFSLGLSSAGARPLYCFAPSASMQPGMPRGPSARRGWARAAAGLSGRLSPRCLDTAPGS